MLGTGVVGGKRTYDITRDAGRVEQADFQKRSDGDKKVPVKL